LLAAASAKRPSAERLRLLTLRVMGAYVIGLRDLCYDRATIDDTVRFVVDYTLA
jgi:hypothetical protein